MSVAYDASSEFPTSTTAHTGASSFSWTHTPVGTPRGVLVFVNSIANAAKATSVTYGGVNVPSVAGGTAVDTAGEPGAVQTFFLGSGIPAGAQTVVVNRVDTTTGMYATAITVTASADTNIGPNIVLLQEDGTFAVQSVDDGSPGTDSLRFAAGYSGGSSVLTAGTGSATTGMQSIDYGVYTFTTARESVAGQGARNVGFTYATSDDRAAVHLAVRESAQPVNNTPPSLKQFANTTWTGGGAKSTSTAISWAVGDLIVVSLFACDVSAPSPIPTISGLSPALAGDTAVGTTSACYTNTYRAIAANSGSAVCSATCSETHWGMAVWVFDGSTSNGWGARSADSGNGLKYISMTRQNSHSAVVGGIADWNAENYASFSWLPSAPSTERTRTYVSTWYSVSAADWLDQATSGSSNYGYSSTGTTTGPWSKVFVEILGEVATGTTYPLSGSATAISDADGSISLIGAITGTAASTSHADGAVTVAHVPVTLGIAGTAAAASSAYGAASLIGAVSGTALGTSSASGALTRVTPLSGSAAAVSAASGTVGLVGAVSGSAAASSHADGSITRVSPLAGSAANVSHGDGAVAIQTGPVTYPVAGSATATSLATGTVAMTALASGFSLAASHAYGAIGQVQPASGTSLSAAVASGAVTLTGAVAGSAASLSIASGTVSLLARVAGSAVASSSASGSVSRAYPLAGSAVSASHGDGAVAVQTGPVTWPLSGSATAASSATGVVALRSAVSGVSVSVSAATATLSATLSLSGQSTTASATAGAISFVRPVAGSAVAESWAYGSLAARLALSGVSIAVSGGDGSILAPFHPGELPSDLRVRVDTDPGIATVISTDGIGSAISMNSLIVEVT